MYGYIDRVKFVSLEVSKNVFTQIFKRKKLKIIVPKENICVVSLTQGNAFIRLKYGEDYLDIKIVNIVIKGNYYIKLGGIVDSSIPQRNIKIK